jgi:purine nucleoside phosphorylase
VCVFLLKQLWFKKGETMDDIKVLPDEWYTKEAERMAGELRKGLGLGPDDTIEILFVAGTGWDKTLKPTVQMDLATLDQYKCLRPPKKGHSRKAGIVTINGKKVGVLLGKVHLFEANLSDTPAKVREVVRLQFEMWAHLGVKRIITTCGAGGLNDETAPTGSVVVVNQIHKPAGIVAPFTEHCSASAPIHSDQLGTLTLPALAALQDIEGLTVIQGAYALELGPDVESPLTKEIRANQGCICIGMSLYTSLGVAHLYGWEAIAVAFLTNGMKGVLAHSDNVEEGRRQSASLYLCLERLVALPSTK